MSRIEWKRNQNDALSRLNTEGHDNGDGLLPAELASDLPVCPTIGRYYRYHIIAYLAVSL